MNFSFTRKFIFQSHEKIWRLFLSLRQHYTHIVQLRVFFSSTAPVHTCVLPIQIIYSKEKVEFWRELFRISFFVSVSQRCSLFAQSKSSLWVVLRSTPLCVSDAHNLPKGKIQTTASICSPSDCKLPSHSCFSLFLFGELSSRYYAELCMILLFFITRTKYNTFNPKSRRVRR